MLCISGLSPHSSNIHFLGFLKVILHGLWQEWQAANCCPFQCHIALSKLRKTLSPCFLGEVVHECGAHTCAQEHKSPPFVIINSQGGNTIISVSVKRWDFETQGLALYHEENSERKKNEKNLLISW